MLPMFRHSSHFFRLANSFAQRERESQVKECMMASSKDKRASMFLLVSGIVNFNRRVQSKHN